MKKTTWLVIALVIVVIIIIAVAGSKPTKNGQIKIGVSLPLTGKLAFIGEAGKNAATLVQNELASSTSLKHTYQFVFEDDSFDAQKGASTVNKLINVDKVSALVTVGSTVGNVAAPIAESAKVPHIGTASDINVAKGQYNFIDWTRPQEEVAALITELQRRHITKVAILGDNQQGFKAIEDDFGSKAQAAGISIVGHETFNEGQKDFRTSIAKLQKTAPQIYLIDSFDPETGVIGKQFQDLGIKTPLTSVESFGLTADPSVFEGQWYVDAAVPTSGFSLTYQATFGKSVGPTAPNVYDELHLLVNAIESIQGEVTGDKIVAALNNETTYSGAMGTLTPGPDGAFISQATVKIIKNGKPEVVK